jgi:hypothetical protein
VSDGEFRNDIRFEKYIALLLGGLSALVLWPSYDKAAKRTVVSSLQAEADSLVAKLLAPNSTES